MAASLLETIEQRINTGVLREKALQALAEKWTAEEASGNRLAGVVRGHYEKLVVEQSSANTTHMLMMLEYQRHQRGVEVFPAADTPDG